VFIKKGAPFHSFTVFFNLVAAFFRNQIVTRWSFVLFLVGYALLHLTSFLTISIIMDRFKEINNWNFTEVAFIYIIVLMSFGLRSTFFSQFRNIKNLVKTGGLDTILIKPVNPFLYLMGNGIELGGIIEISVGIVLLITINPQLYIVWNWVTILLFILIILSAALVQAAVTIMIGTTSFFFLESSGLERLYNAFREFIWFPVTLYNKIIQVILFTIIPLAFASYVPAGALLQHHEYSIFPRYVWQISLLMGVVLFIIAYCFWKIGLQHYESTGS
jgi:ABC-2 type transport system permease protein